MEEKINSTSLSSLLFALTKSCFLGAGATFLFNYIDKTSILSLFAGLIVSILFLIIIYNFFSIYPDKEIDGKIKELYPKLIYYFLIILIIISVFILSVFCFYKVIGFLSTHYLVKTPNIITSTLLIIPIIFLSINNKETLTRFSTIAFFICLLILIFNCVSLLPHADLFNVLPIKITESSNFIKVALVISLITSGPVFLITTIKKNSITDKKKLKKKVFIHYILSILATMIILTIVLAGLGINLVKIFVYPEYIVLKKISLFDFITNVENIGVLLWYFYETITVSLGFLFIKNTIGNIFKITTNKKKNITIYIISLIMILLSLVIFKADASFDDVRYTYIPALIGLIFIFISLLSLIIYFFKKKKNNSIINA